MIPRPFFQAARQPGSQAALSILLVFVFTLIAPIQVFAANPSATLFPFATYSSDSGLAGGIKHFVYDIPEPGAHFESFEYLSLNGQFIWELLLSKQLQNGSFDRLRLQTQNYQTYFYGTGNSNNPSLRGRFTVPQVDLSYQFGQRNPDHSLWALYAEAQFTSALGTDGSSLFSTVTGLNGGNAYHTGIRLGLDNLDRDENSLEGEYIAGQVEAVSGSHQYFQGAFDYRRYFKIDPDMYFAFRSYADMVAGDPALYQVPALGGANRLRGFSEGRFRDNSDFGFGVELRKDLVLPSDWHFPWPVQAAGFIDAGKVLPVLYTMTLDDFHASEGIGLRILLRPESVVRIDWGFGEDEQGIYFTFGQAI